MQHAAPTRCKPRDGHGAGQSAGRGGCTVSSSTRQDHASCSEAAQRAAGAWDALLEPFQHHAGVAARTSSRSSQARRLKEHTTFERAARSTSDLHSRTQRSSARATRKVPRSGVGMDGRPMFLRVHSAYVHSQGRTLYMCNKFLLGRDKFLSIELEPHTPHPHTPTHPHNIIVGA